jgi:hypothetical protein
VLRPETAKAEPWTASIKASQDAPTLEASAGADVTAHSWSTYTGLTATFGGSLFDDGWRIRLGGGYGAYSYSSTRWTGSAVVVVPFDGTVTFADALIGYQQQWGALTLKVFAGAVAQHNSMTPVDIESSVHGTRWGAKGAVEAWLDIGASAFAQLDPSTTAMARAFVSATNSRRSFPPVLKPASTATSTTTPAVSVRSFGMTLRWVRSPYPQVRPEIDPR